MWVSNQLLKAADLALCPKAIALFEDLKKTTRDSENEFVSSRGGFCETITPDARNPISKYFNERPQDNQQKGVIPNQVGN